MPPPRIMPPFISERGGLPVTYKDCMYAYIMAGTHGKRYYKEGCRKRPMSMAGFENIALRSHREIKRTRPKQAAVYAFSRDTMTMTRISTVSRPRARPAANAPEPRPAAARGTHTTKEQRQPATTVPQGARPPLQPRSINAPQPQVTPKPISASSIAVCADSELSKADEEVSGVNADKPQLEQRYMELKMKLGLLKERKMEQDFRHDEEINELKKRKLELKIQNLERGVTKKTPSGLSVPIGKANHVTINGSNGSNGPVPPE